MTATVRGTRLRRAAALPLLLAALGTLAACATPVDYGPKPTLSGSTTQLSVKPSFYGQVVTDGTGRTLYQFSGDRDGQPTCYDACAETFQPYIANGEPVETNMNVTVLERSSIATTPRRDGQQQVTYAGRPLYFFAADGKQGNVYGPDDVKGVGQSQFGGRWTAVSTQGKSVNP